MVDLEISTDHRTMDLAPRKVSNIPSKLFGGPWKVTLSRSRLIENLFFVAMKIRPASMFHPVDLREIVEVRRAAQASGVGMISRKAGSRVYKVFLFNEEREEMAGLVPDIDETMGKREFILGQITIANFTGAFLGYPKCCVDNFITHLMNATDQDLDAMEQLRSEPSPDPHAYFVERFVPCSPRCVNASREGERVEEILVSIYPSIMDEYLSLRLHHMEDVREGRIVEEKRQRDIQLKEGR